MPLPDPGLVLHIPMNEGAGTTAYDASRYGNDGALTGCKWVEHGLEFNGTSDYVDCGNNASLQFNVNDFSIGIWLKTYSSATDSAITKRRDTGTLHGFNVESRCFSCNG